MGIAPELEDTCAAIPVLDAARDGVDEELRAAKVPEEVWCADDNAAIESDELCGAIEIESAFEIEEIWADEGLLGDAWAREVGPLRACCVDVLWLGCCKLLVGAAELELVTMPTYGDCIDDEVWLTCCELLVWAAKFELVELLLAGNCVGAEL
jgi:hypothetical protein